ncbi:hypothetical protein [Rhizobium yanglingense]
MTIELTAGSNSSVRSNVVSTVIHGRNVQRFRTADWCIKCWMDGERAGEARCLFAIVANEPLATGTKSTSDKSRDSFAEAENSVKVPGEHIHAFEVKIDGAQQGYSAIFTSSAKSSPALRKSMASCRS